MLYTIFITLCLASAPTECQHYTKIFTPKAANPGYAYIETQEFVAKWWIEEHPDTTLRFRVVPGRPV